MQIYTNIVTNKLFQASIIVACFLKQYSSFFFFNIGCYYYDITHALKMYFKKVSKVELESKMPKKYSL